MTNYTTQFLPVYKPEDWMTVEIGDNVGSLTLDRLKDYLINGEKYFTQFNHSTDASLFLASNGLNFYSDVTVDHWRVESSDGKLVSDTIYKTQDTTNKINVKVVDGNKINETTKVIIKGLDKNQSVVYKALLNILV